MKLPKIENMGLIGILVLTALLFFFFVLSFSAAMAVLGIILLLILPIYLILDNFELGQDEKIIFSFFIGVGIFPSIAYLLGLIISFRISIFITFIILIIAAILLKKYKK